MTKVLGFRNGEISRLYLFPIFWVVAASLLISLPITIKVLVSLWRVVFRQEMSGWIPIYLDPAVLVKMVLLGMLAFLVVAVLENRKIHRIPMEEALKNIE